MFFHTARLTAFVASKIFRQILGYLLEDVFVGRVTQFNTSGGKC
jgi:hypothetical protein